LEVLKGDRHGQHSAPPVDRFRYVARLLDEPPAEAGPLHAREAEADVLKRIPRYRSRKPRRVEGYQVRKAGG